MSNVSSVLSTMYRFDAEERERNRNFIGPATQSASEVRVGDVIDFVDEFKGNRYTGRVISFGDGVHVGSMQMRVEVLTFNGVISASQAYLKDGLNQVNVKPSELINIRGK